MPAVYEPIPTAINIYPNWLIVEYAIILLISNWVSAINAAKNAVNVPIMSTTSEAAGE